MGTDTTSLDLYGKDVRHAELQAGYQTHESYDGQGEYRVVKDLFFPVHIRTPNPMYPDTEVVQERMIPRNTRVHVEELGLIALEKGERLGAFYTDAELAAGVPGVSRPVVTVSSDQLDAGGSVAEFGEGELVGWLMGSNTGSAPSVDEIVEAVGTDKDLARRVIEAEKLREPDDPRKTLINRLTKVAEA